MELSDLSKSSFPVSVNNSRESSKEASIPNQMSSEEDNRMDSHMRRGSVTSAYSSGKRLDSPMSDLAIHQSKQCRVPSSRSIRDLQRHHQNAAGFHVLINALSGVRIEPVVRDRAPTDSALKDGAFHLSAHLSPPHNTKMALRDGTLFRLDGHTIEALSMSKRDLQWSSLATLGGSKKGKKILGLFTGPNQIYVWSDKAKVYSIRLVNRKISKDFLFERDQVPAAIFLVRGSDLGNTIFAVVDSSSMLSFVNSSGQVLSSLGSVVTPVLDVSVNFVVAGGSRITVHRHDMYRIIETRVLETRCKIEDARIEGATIFAPARGIRSKKPSEHLANVIDAVEAEYVCNCDDRGAVLSIIDIVGQEPLPPPRIDALSRFVSKVLHAFDRGGGN